MWKVGGGRKSGGRTAAPSALYRLLGNYPVIFIDSEGHSKLFQRSATTIWIMVLLGKMNQRDHAASRPRKRQRVDKATQQSKPALGTVNVDLLHWNEVPLPDRLDDAEGFFGLEEVDDVEVIRDTASGILEFRVGKAQQNCRKK